MKWLLFPLFLFVIFSQPLFAQDVNAGWEKWAYMFGEWKGEGSGQPGTGAGTFTLKTKLGGSILERKGKTEIAATASNPAMPRFRLIYEKLEDKVMNIRFEIAIPGAPEDFKMYLEGKSRKAS